jgi:ribonuclease BN (tRNA processing enzyme)
MFKENGKLIHFCMSHVHWDHIQGFPFFAPLFIPRRVLPNNKFVFFGGVQWQGALEEVLRGQMDSPVFPVEWDKVTAEGPAMKFLTIHHGFEAKIAHGSDKEKPSSGEASLKSLRLHHPNETYGWRIEHQGKVFVFASDTEPFAGGPDPVILELAQGADLLYLDCQFTREQYLGKAGPPRLGWGHGYDEWCAEVAIRAGVKHLLLGHHDPAASDEQIFNTEQKVAKIVREQTVCDVRAAYDGMEINVK